MFLDVTASAASQPVYVQEAALPLIRRAVSLRLHIVEFEANPAKY